MSTSLLSFWLPTAVCRMNAHRTLIDISTCLNALLNQEGQHHQTSSDTSVAINQWETEEALKFNKRLSSQLSFSKSEPNNKKEKHWYAWTEQMRSDLPGDMDHFTHSAAYPCPILPPSYSESTWVNTAPQASKTLPTCITPWDRAVASWGAHYMCVVRLANITLP